MQIGDTYEYKNVVTKEITAGALGSGGLDIFATPFLICWMEAAAYYYMKEQLPEGKSSVGTMVNVRHVSPSPIAAEIKASGADMALVCLGAPKQELFMAKYGEATGCHLLMGLGGSMDIFAGVAQRAPEFYCKHNLEWFYRLIKNPSRIGRMMKLPLFLVHVSGEKRK